MRKYNCFVFWVTLQADTMATCVQVFHRLFKRYALLIIFTSSVIPIDSTCFPSYQFIHVSGFGVSNGDRYVRTPVK